MIDLDWSGGIEFDRENLNYLLFADDCAIFAHDAIELQAKLVQLQMKTSEIGLEMNSSKTKWMHNQFGPTATVKINGETIKEVKCFKFLGHQLSFTEGSSGEYSRRRKAAWSSFNKISTLLLDEDLPMKLKASLFHSTVIPAMLYGAKCWSSTKADEEKFAVMQRSMERRICKVSLRSQTQSCEDEMALLMLSRKCINVNENGPVMWHG
uniref:Reverse transcriptase domain-containing protein n=1 Tax=Haemonchus contortus TaxID=6289 RepID=A0A7I4YGZ8_HAECO